jgi:hypothetical protein
MMQDTFPHEKHRTGMIMTASYKEVEAVEELFSKNVSITTDLRFIFFQTRQSLRFAVDHE